MLGVCLAKARPRISRDWSIVYALSSSGREEQGSWVKVPGEVDWRKGECFKLLIWGWQVVGKPLALQRVLLRHVTPGLQHLAIELANPREDASHAKW
jgi:hypothetical protein